MKKFDWLKYEELSFLEGISFFDTHGACFNCVNDLTGEFPNEFPCTCLEEESKQLKIIKICKWEVL